MWFKCTMETLFIIYPGKKIQDLFGVLHKLFQCEFMSDTEAKNGKGSGEFTQCKF